MLILILAALCTTVCLGTDDVLRFIVIADNGGHETFPFTTPIELATAHRMAQVAEQVGGIDFVLELGDNFYKYGIRNVDDPRFKYTFENVYTAKSLQVPWYIIAGNHDHIGNVSAQIEYSKLSSKWHFPDFYYPLSFKIPNSDASVDILMLDTVMLAGLADDETQLQPQGPEDPVAAFTQWGWIEEHLKASKATYLFAAGHYPIYSISKHGTTIILDDFLRPMLVKHKASGYMCGHDHNLQYLQETKDNVTLDFILSGCSDRMELGKNNQGKVPPGVSKFHWADPKVLGAFVLVEASASKLVSKYITADGKLVYTSVTRPRKFGSRP